MKTLTSATSTLLANRTGVKPVTVVAIHWSGSSVTYYADKTLPQAEGKLLRTSKIESVLNLNNLQSFQADISLDDTDGTIKAIIETTDIHKIKCVIYQYFEDLDFDADKFVLFQGQISTPFSWGENDRQVNFTVLSEIESYEVGFSPEEGQLDNVNKEFVGRPWPLAFGDVVRVPATKVRQQSTATLLERFCRVDPLLEYKVQNIANAFQQTKVYFEYQLLMQQAIRDAVPSVAITADYYVAIINEEYAIMLQVYAVQNQLQHAERQVPDNPDDLLLRILITALRENLRDLALVSHEIERRKRIIEERIDLITYLHDLLKDVMLKLLDAYDALRSLMADYLNALQALCRQRECEKTVLSVDNDDAEFSGEKEVCINGVRYLVDFTGDQMTIKAGPSDEHGKLLLDTWTPDVSDTCNDTTGLNLIYLDDATINLEGKYLLVKARGLHPDDCTRHVLEVIRQDGNKVYYKLVTWNTASGRPEGLSLDVITEEIIGTVEGLGGFDDFIPASVFVGQLDPSLKMRPETALLLQAIANINRPVSEEELRYLITLAFRAKMDEMRVFGIISPTPRDTYTIVGEDIECIIAASGIVNPTWLNDYCIPDEELPDNMYLEAAAGSEIVLCGDNCDVYVANIVPSTVKAVEAFRTNEDGFRYLTPVPSDYYILNENQDVNGYNIVTLTFKQPLTDKPNEGWEDAVYVTMNSSVGPNVADVMKWLLETYTDKTVNTASYDAFKILQDKYPVGFALFNRPNVLQEVSRIAWECRSTVYLKGDEFYFVYLSQLPTSVVTVTEADIDEGKLNVSYNSTESLITRMVAVWKEHYADLGKEDPQIVLRHNIKKYGLQSSTEEFHIYNIKELVVKSATFWLIRRANTWKHVSFSSWHKMLKYDTLDGLTMDLARTFVSTADFIGLIESIGYDSATGKTSVVLETGIKAGETTQYSYYYPALESATEWPPEVEVELGYAGGFGPGTTVSGTIGDC